MPASALPPDLPVPNAAPVSKETRLAYVLRHFRLAYEQVPNVSVGYAEVQPAITIADAAGAFFQQSTAYPPAPNFREWAGQRVPFFFDSQPELPLVELGADVATIHADLIAAAFYLLSGWQEYFSDIRDRHGRFSYAASVQQQYGFVALPVVNYYFDVLKTAVEHVSGQVLRLRPWRAGAPFAAFITHDIDNLRSAWKAPAKAALKQGRLLRFGQHLFRHFTQPDAWDNLEAVAATTAAYGAKSTFFILPANQRGADGTPNADYCLSTALLVRLQKLKELGCEISLHGSIGTAANALQLEEEIESLRHGTTGLRFHYLRWEPRQTPDLVDSADRFSYDSTLGFAEHFGFRHSYCLPFYPYNFQTGAAHDFLEIPLNVMDATLHHPNYLQLRAAEILPALRPMLEEIIKFGGVATVLWHNDHFDPANHLTGPRQFAEIMHYLRQHGAAFLTGSQIVAELRP